MRAMTRQVATMLEQQTLEDRRALCSAVVSLDGRPAVICGAQERFATVATLPDGPSYEWSWSTASRIVASGGAFKSGSR